MGASVSDAGGPVSAQAMPLILDAIEACVIVPFLWVEFFRS